MRTIAPKLFLALLVGLLPVLGSCQDEFVKQVKNYEKDIAENQQHALVTLLNIQIAQTLFYKKRVNDRDNNGIPEFGDLAEINKAQMLPGPKKGKAPVMDGNHLLQNGYVFKILLPSNTKRRQFDWAALAWPLMYNQSGTQAYLMQANGVIYANPNDGTKDLFSEEGLDGPTIKQVYDNPDWLSRFKEENWEMLDLTELKAQLKKEMEK